MTPEGKVKAKVKEVLKELGVWYCMPMGQAYGKRGVPDFICCYKGYFIGIETKSATGRLTPTQRLERELIWKAGGIYYEVNPGNVNDLKEMLTCINAENT